MIQKKLFYACSICSEFTEKDELYCEKCITNGWKLPSKWTEETPTKPGFYWILYPSQHSRPNIVQIHVRASLTKNKVKYQLWLMWNDQKWNIEDFCRMNRGIWGKYRWKFINESPTLPDDVVLARKRYLEGED